MSNVIGYVCSSVPSPGGCPLNPITSSNTFGYSDSSMPSPGGCPLKPSCYMIKSVPLLRLFHAIVRRLFTEALP